MQSLCIGNAIKGVKNKSNAMTLRQIKMGKIYERDHSSTGNYHQINIILSAEEYQKIKKYSRQKKSGTSGKYLLVLSEEIRDETGMQRTERTIDMFETDKIKRHKSMWGVIFLITIGAIILYFIN